MRSLRDLGKPPEPHPWWVRAQQHAEANRSWHEVGVATPELRSWVEYFERLGWMPWTVKQVKSGQRKSFTAPERFPKDLPAHMQARWW